MKRRSLAAVAAAMLLLALVPGSAGASPFPAGTLDQSVDHGAGRYSSAAPLSQTFTGGQTGFLVHVQLYCDSGTPGDLSVSLTVNAVPTGTSVCGPTPGWVDFSMNGPLQILPGQPFTIALAGGSVIGLGVAAADYAGGAASASGAPIPDVSDFAFRTYVYTASTTTYAWSLPQVTAASTTTVTLTTTTAFDSGLAPTHAVSVAPNPLATGLLYTVKLDAVPAWFTATGITCSAQIAPADCTFANFKSGLNMTGDGSAMTVTVTVTGQATPAAADGGSTGTAGGEGCIVTSSVGADPFHLCSTNAAGLVVVAPGATPPPTTAGVSGSSGDSPSSWWLLAGLWALFCSLLVMAGRRVRQVR